MYRIVTIKDITYKGKKYKFLQPLKAKVESSLAIDAKTMVWELYIPIIPDGFTRLEPIEDPEKEFKLFVKNVFDEYIMKEDKDLNNPYDVEYRHKWISLIKPPK